MKKMLEINPLECPYCKNEMRIIAFITDTREISKIMDSLGVKGPDPPRPITKVAKAGKYIFDEQEEFVEEWGQHNSEEFI